MSTTMKKFSCLMCLCVFALTAMAASAQTSLGILVGVVRDQTGAVVPTASVTIVGNEDGISRTALTQSDGAYRIEALRPQNYTVKTTKAGFSLSTAKDVIVTPSNTTTYGVKLNVGGSSETVSVEADSISIDTENGQLTGIVNSTDITKLPIFSLSPYELATTVPGAQIDSDSGFSNGQALQINGARPRANNFLLDGQEINDVAIAGQAF